MWTIGEADANDGRLENCFDVTRERQWGVVQNFNCSREPTVRILVGRWGNYATHRFIPLAPECQRRSCFKVVNGYVAQFPLAEDGGGVDSG